MKRLNVAAGFILCACGALMCVAAAPSETEKTANPEYTYEPVVEYDYGKRPDSIPTADSLLPDNSLSSESNPTSDMDDKPKTADIKANNARYTKNGKTIRTMEPLNSEAKTQYKSTYKAFKKVYRSSYIQAVSGENMLFNDDEPYIFDYVEEPVPDRGLYLYGLLDNGKVFNVDYLVFNRKRDAKAFATGINGYAYIGYEAKVKNHVVIVFYSYVSDTEEGSSKSAEGLKQQFFEVLE